MKTTSKMKMTTKNKTKMTSTKLYIYIGVGSRDLFIDETHNALGIFPVFFPCMLPTSLCGIFDKPDKKQVLNSFKHYHFQNYNLFKCYLSISCEESCQKRSKRIVTNIKMNTLHITADCLRRKILSNSRLSLNTKSWLCFNPVTRTTRTRTTPHQNLSEGGVLEGWNLTYRILMGFWLSLGAWVRVTQVMRRTRTTRRALSNYNNWAY